MAGSSLDLSRIKSVAGQPLPNRKPRNPGPFIPLITIGINDDGTITAPDPAELRAGIIRLQQLVRDCAKVVRDRDEMRQAEVEVDCILPFDVAQRDAAEQLPVIITQSPDSDLAVRADGQVCHPNPLSVGVSFPTVTEAGERRDTLPGGGAA